jgi:hypothetical protein
MNPTDGLTFVILMCCFVGLLIGWLRGHTPDPPVRYALFGLPDGWVVNITIGLWIGLFVIGTH